MSGAMYYTTYARERKRAQALRFDADDVPAAPCERWDADDAEPQFPDEEQVVAAVDVPAKDHSLDAMYAAMSMLDSRSETVLFDRDVCATATPQHETELCRELNAAFPKCLEYQDVNNPPGSKQLMQQIAYYSNYEVQQVARVMNRSSYRMQQAFAENYNVSARRTVYHGTSEAGAPLIAAVGFKGAACRRALWGRGLYTSPNVWEALAYAKPYSNVKQVLFVVELLQGPTALGSQDQIDFGVDSDDREVLTLTNPSATILCHAKENQLLATHRITLRYMVEHNFCQRNRECVLFMHADVVLVAATPHATYTYVDAPHRFFHIGDRIVVTDTLRAYCEFKGMTGVVCRIVKAHSFLLCVRPDTVHHRVSVRRLNAQPANSDRCSFLQKDEDDLLLLTLGQVRITHTAHPPQDDTVRGKRKKDAAL